MAYLWISNGGCDICDAMAGEHEEQPVRPHPNCRCEIIDLDSPTTADVYYWFEETDRENFPDEIPERLVIYGTLFVQCCDGSVKFKDVEIELERASEDEFWDLDDWDAKEEAEVRALEAAECPDCPPFLCC